MKEIDVFREMASRTTGDRPPDIHVTEQVLATLARRSAAPTELLWALTGASAALVGTAATLAILAVQAWQTWLDPITELFSLCYQVMP